MRELDTTGALDLSVAWLVFFVLGVYCLLSLFNTLSPLSDTLKDTWLLPEEGSLSEFPGGTIGGSAHLFLFLLEPFPWTETLLGLGEEDWCLLLRLALEDLDLASSTGRSRSVMPMWTWSRMMPGTVRILWMWTSRSPMRTGAFTSLMRMESTIRTPRSRTGYRSGVRIRSGSRRWSP